LSRLCRTGTLNYLRISMNFCQTSPAYPSYEQPVSQSLCISLSQVLLLPPMQRRVPFWFVRWFNSIMLVFDNVFHQANIPNVYIIPSFPNPEFQADCVHLTEESGHRYYPFFAISEPVLVYHTLTHLEYVHDSPSTPFEYLQTICRAFLSVYYFKIPLSSCATFLSMYTLH
jgi:hypothetical protein